MTKNLKWRLAKLPTPDEIRGLVADKIITNEEAREILISQTAEEEANAEALQSEIKFLRELIKSLSSRSQIVETIREVYKPYRNWDWYKPYEMWCSTYPYATGGGGGGVTISTGGTSTLANLASSDLNNQISPIGIIGASDFNEIKTF